MHGKASVEAVNAVSPGGATTGTAAAPARGVLRGRPVSVAPETGQATPPLADGLAGRRSGAVRARRGLARREVHHADSRSRPYPAPSSPAAVTVVPERPGSAAAEKLARLSADVIRKRPLDPRINAPKLGGWLLQKAEDLYRKLLFAKGEFAELKTAEIQRVIYIEARHAVRLGHDPLVDADFYISHLAVRGDVNGTEAAESVHAQLTDIMADPSMLRPAM